MPNPFPADRLRATLAAVDDLLAAIGAGEVASQRRIAGVPSEQRASARNLAHYLAARGRDLRPLQAELHALALSSLGRMESHVRGTVTGVRNVLSALLGERPAAAAAAAPGEDLDGEEGARRLARHNERLLGVRAAGREAHIMVTLPSTAATDAELSRRLLRAGMDVARINLAHDGPPAWTAMVDNVRGAAADLGKRCRILVDLPGPKLRTGALPPGPRVVRVKPQRDALGRCTTPVAVLFHDPAPAAAAPPDGAVRVPLATPLLARAALGDEVLVTDTRGRMRVFRVAAAAGGNCVATCERTAYLGTGCEVQWRRDGAVLGTGRIGELPALPSFVPLRPGDTLEVTRDEAPPDAVTDAVARTGVAPASVPCTLPEVFADVRSGHRIFFDDGKIAGTVVANDGDRLRVRIDATPPGGARLRAEKGINLPDTELRLSALTAVDRDHLVWATRHADLVGMSFVQRPEDVGELHEALLAAGRSDLGIVLKIETAHGFRRLPELLFAGLRHPSLGVMVARGDLAVEVGYARLAEVQEEILWLCEAAHVPVIWATQVLDAMARTGVPSRAEVSDAAMGSRAECVMLNKGPYIAEAVELLASVLLRMQDHAAKKLSLLRRLHVAASEEATRG